MAQVARRFRYDIEISQGMDEYFPMRIQRGDGTIPDLTGWTGTAQVYRSPATLGSLHDQLPIISGTHNNILSLGSFDGGDFGTYNVLLTITTAITSVLRPWGRGVYFVDIIDPFGHVQF